MHESPRRRPRLWFVHVRRLVVENIFPVVFWTVVDLFVCLYAQRTHRVVSDREKEKEESEEKETFGARARVYVRAQNQRTSSALPTRLLATWSAARWRNLTSLTALYCYRRHRRQKKTISRINRAKNKPLLFCSSSFSSSSLAK